MDYILTGDTKAVNEVIRENRIRIERGVIKFTPLVEEVEETTEDTKVVEETDGKEVNEVTDTKEVVEDDGKEVLSKDAKTAPTKEKKRNTK